MTNNGETDSNKYVGFGTRFVAYWIDNLVLFFIGIGVQFLFGINPFAIFSVTTISELTALQKASSASPVGFVAFGLAIAYFLYMQVNQDGATIGKKVMGIKVVKVDDSKLTYGAALIRYIGQLISALVLGLGFLSILWDSRKQGWHDKMANTVVVKSGSTPQTALGIVLALLGITLSSGYMIGAFIKGVELGAASARPQSSLQQNMKTMPASAKVHYDKTQSLFKQMQLVGSNRDALEPIADETIKEARLAVEQDPSNAELWSNLGDAYGWPNTLATGEDSLKAYQKASDLDPTNVVFSNFVGDQLIRMGRNDEAVLQLQKSLRLTDKSGYAHLSLARAYVNLKVYNEARTQYTEAVEVFQKQNSEGQFDKVILDAQKEMSTLPVQ